LSSPENGSLAEASIRLASGLYRAGLSRFVGLGTCLEYAPNDRALREEDPRSADARPYVRAKLHALDGIFALAPTVSSFSWARIFYPYGSGEPSEKFLPSALKILSENGELTLRRPADIVDYIHVTDVALAICAVAMARDGGIVNIGSGRPLTVSQVADIAQNECCGNGKIIVSAQSDSISRFADTTRLKSLDWKPSISLEEGMRSMLER
jgi:nucleoside-diphosphate-sugar epimerase